MLRDFANAIPSSGGELCAALCFPEHNAVAFGRAHAMHTILISPHLGALETQCSNGHLILVALSPEKAWVITPPPILIIKGQHNIKHTWSYFVQMK